MRRLTTATILSMAIGASFSLADVAQAQSSPGDLSYTTRVNDGENTGRVRRDGPNGRARAGDQYQAGNEHSTMAQLSSGEIIIISMSSKEGIANAEEVNLGDKEVQGLCSSITFDQNLGPQLSTQAYISNNDGDRYRNFHHPSCTQIVDPATGATEDAVYCEYNYAPNNNNRAQTYGVVIGPGCEVLTDNNNNLAQPNNNTLVQAKNNDDCLNSKQDHMSFISKDGDTYYMASIDGCNGNGRDDAWARTTALTKNGDGSWTVDKLDDISIEADEERTRGDMVCPVDQPGFCYACWTAGNTQPPNKGVRCGGIDVSNPNDIEILWREYIARRDGRVYETEIRIASMLDATGRETSDFLASWQRGNGLGRRNGGPGSYRHGMVVAKATPEGLNLMNVPVDVAPTLDVTHGEVCSTLWGETPTASSATVSVHGSLLGSSNTIAQGFTVAYDSATNTLSEGSAFSLGQAHDSGWISNIYGNNPNTQGRNFFDCESISNPFYGVPGAWENHVRSFVGLSMNPRFLRENEDLNEDKLSLAISLIAAVTDPPGVDPTPNPNPEPGEEPGEGGGGEPGTGGGNSGGEGGSGGNTGVGGGCAVNGNGSGLGMMALFGLALVFVTRRRRRS